nr:MAG TPA: AAA lid domain protein [Caudoviricetes sp.]
MSGNGRFVRNVQIVREWLICPDCPKIVCYYYAAGFGNQLTGNRKHCISRREA